MIYKNNSGDEFEIIGEYIKKVGKTSYTMWLIKFLATGTTMEVYKANASKGKVKDPYKRTVHNIGYIGFFDKSIPYWKRAKQLWSNMIKRCYDPVHSKGYYGRGYTVCERWLCFSNFLEDLPELKNFDLWLEGFKPHKTKYNLDKDLVKRGNKVYCLGLCQFITEYENKSAGARNGKPFTKRKNTVGNG